MSNFIDSLINLISPKACVICGHRLTVNEHLICAKCNLHLPRTHHTDDQYENEMAQLFWHRIPIERCAAFMLYAAGAQNSDIIYDLKYRNHPEIGTIMGELIAEEFAPKGFFEEIDVIIPVPLAKKRMRERGYNQSMEIARGVSKSTGIIIDDGVVKRKSFVKSQTMKDRWARADNVANVFELVSSERITGKHILLIDDVVTTGATLCACGEQLAQAGNVRISILTIGFANGIRA